ncbi:hypothetical protein LIER_31899 [Lithospermum erythrorhizon]|uniref:Reverse transcriptase/retrotransposon-derived protein RNase H-like domain-containing protein n=1 Tax=Lithospermum erythrorhizon TaxID=34254 RepID=A0AAV3RSC1_LITER
MKKGTPYVWDAACSTTFQDVKTYLMSPSVLATPIQGKLLILYVAGQEQSVGALFAQENEEGKENALYYLSNRMTPKRAEVHAYREVVLDPHIRHTAWLDGIYNCNNSRSSTSPRKLSKGKYWLIS